MRIIDYDLSYQTKRKSDRKVATSFGVLLGIIAFLFGLGAGFGAALVFGLLTFAFLFGTIYGLRALITKRVYQKLRDIQVDGRYIEVTLRSEIGILVFTPTKVIYHPLQMGAANKEITFEINEDLMMVFGEIKSTKWSRMRAGGIPQGHVLLRQMPHGLYRQFVYYDIDNAIEKVGAILEEISQFRPEKFQ